MKKTRVDESRYQHTCLDHRRICHSASCIAASRVGPSLSYEQTNRQKPTRERRNMKKTRTDESRQKLVDAFYFALGAYTEQEAKKEDTWRDQSIGQLYAHLAHEVTSEIRGNLKRNDRLTWLLHNCVDAVCLSLILLSKVMDMVGIGKEE